MTEQNSSPETKIALFKGQKVRRSIYKNEWWFVITDVVNILTDSVNVKGYIMDLRRRDKELSKGWWQIATPLFIDTLGGKQKLNCANTEGILRIIQSIHSPKAEPFKRWLAQVGYERIQEIENPELAAKKIRELYRAKGYPDSWIDKRMRGIDVRETLTREWGKRGVKEGLEYSILTAEIAKATFGMSPNQHKKYKNLKRENLRDHMNDLELIFSMLGEASTTEIIINRDVKGFPHNKKAAQQGGEVAGKARGDIERKSGKKVVSRENFLELEQKGQKSIPE